MRPRHGDGHAAQHRLGPHRGMGQPQRCFHLPIVHAPDERTISHLLHPLQDLIDVAFPVHEMKQAWRRGGPCCPGRFPHHLTGLVDALEPCATFLSLWAHGVSCRPRPDLEPQDAKHRALLG